MYGTIKINFRDYDIFIAHNMFPSHNQSVYKKYVSKMQMYEYVLGEKALSIFYRCLNIVLSHVGIEKNDKLVLSDT